MRIIVPIKQVPETSNVKMDPESGTMIREGIESIINPLDLYAIEIAIQLKEKYGGTVTAVSMGPMKAEEALREAVAMGCDDGMLLSNKAFAGSDTYATSYALAQAVKKMGSFDLIICGERATDGDTGQVGPGMAAWLGLPVGTYISEFIEAKGRSILVKRLVEDGYETLDIEMPCLLTVVKEIAYPRLPTLRGKQRARQIEIPVRGPEYIGADMNLLGLNGSPTRVVKIESPKIARDGEIRTPREQGELDAAVDGIIKYLEKIEVL
ncbi:MAG: electron transfer flavoprotein subunit beta/FixA family protein [Bacillota bacterium]